MESQATNDTVLQQLGEMSAKVWLQYALNAAIELNIVDTVGDTPITAEDLAAQLKLHPPTVYRLMRALASNGFFQASEGHGFCHNSSSRTLRKDTPHSLRSVVQLFGLPPMQKAWMHMNDAVRDGKSAFSHAHGKELYTHLADDKKSAAVFNASMTAFSQPQIRDVATQYRDFGRCQKILDVAGGAGHLLAAILKHYPALKGSVLDLPHLQAPAEAFLREAGVSDRGTFVTGNMFEILPMGFDAYVIKNALWNWSDAEGVRVLRNMRKALGANTTGRVLVIEQLITEANRSYSALFDLQMLVATHSGRARTETEFVAAGKEAGLRHSRTLPLGDTHLMEFFPA